MFPRIPDTASDLMVPGWRRTALVTLCIVIAPIGAVLAASGWGTLWGWSGAGILCSAAAIGGLAVFGRVGGCAPQARPAGLRFVRRMVLTMGCAYPILLFGSLWLFLHGFTQGPLGFVVAIVPALPLIGVFVIFYRFLREETDEVLRAGLMTALVWSGALTLCEANVWGFLETFGKVPHVWTWAVPLAFFAQFGITAPLAARRYS